MRNTIKAKFCSAFVFFIGVTFSVSIEAKARRPLPGKNFEKYNLTQSKPILIEARKTKLPLVVYGETPGEAATFIPSGYMGDSNSITVLSANVSGPVEGQGGTHSLRFRYTPKGREGWVGVYWQTPANNWGEIKGAGYDLRAAKRLRFWARGENGNEEISDVKVGGISGSYPDTDFASIGPIVLKKEWQRYSIDLEGKDLRHIVGGFAVILKRSANRGGAQFYLDEIVFDDGTEPDEFFVENANEVAGASKKRRQPAPNTPDVKDEKKTASGINSSDVEEASPNTEGNQADKSLVGEELVEKVSVVVPFSSSDKGISGAESEMEKAVKFASKYPKARIRVEGHADDSGNANLNDKLSYDRAKEVADYLQSKGVSRERMTVNGYGSKFPLEPGSNKTGKGQSKNRRVEIILVPN